jgi:hypothetical protein
MQHITNNSEVATKQVLHFIHNHHALALQLPSCACPDDDCLSDQTSTMNNSLPSPEFNRLSGRAYGCSGDDFGMYPWGMVGCTRSRRRALDLHHSKPFLASHQHIQAGMNTLPCVLHHTTILMFIRNDQNLTTAWCETLVVWYEHTTKQYFAPSMRQQTSTFIFHNSTHTIHTRIIIFAQPGLHTLTSTQMTNYAPDVQDIVRWCWTRAVKTTDVEF